MSESWPTILTAGVALYGAILSSINYWSLQKTRKRSIEVEIKRGFLVQAGHATVRGPNFVLINAKNTGFRSVVLSTPGFVLPNKREAVIPLPFGDVNLPHELKDGNKCSIWIDPKEIMKALKQEKLAGRVKLKGYFVDALGQRHMSKSFLFDMDSE